MQTFTQNAHIAEYDTFPIPFPFPFIATGNVWRYDKKIQGSRVIDWWDGGVAQPQLALGDFIQALHPQPNYTTTFLRNIAKGEGTIDVSIEGCTHDRSTPMEPILVPCNSFQWNRYLICTLGLALGHFQSSMAKNYVNVVREGFSLFSGRKWPSSRKSHFLTCSCTNGAGLGRDLGWGKGLAKYLKRL